MSVRSPIHLSTLDVGICARACARSWLFPLLVNVTLSMAVPVPEPLLGILLMFGMCLSVLCFCLCLTQDR